MPKKLNSGHWTKVNIPKQIISSKFLKQKESKQNEMKRKKKHTQFYSVQIAIKIINNWKYNINKNISFCVCVCLRMDSMICAVNSNGSNELLSSNIIFMWIYVHTHENILAKILYSLFCRSAFRNVVACKSDGSCRYGTVRNLRSCLSFDNRCIHRNVCASSLSVN